MNMAALQSMAAYSQAKPVEPGIASRLAERSSSSPAISEPQGFSDLVQTLFRQTNHSQVAADSAIQDFATGKSDNIQQVVLAMANADLSFQFFMEIRNKVIDSYNELMRMQF